MISLSQVYRDIAKGYRFNFRPWLLAGIISSLTAFPFEKINVDQQVFGLVAIISLLLSMLMLPGITSMSLHEVRGETVSTAEIFKKIHLFPRFLGLFLVYMLIVALGTVALILPGIYLAIRYWPAQYLLIEKNLGITESFALSSAQTKGKILSLLWALLVLCVSILPFYIIPEIIFGACGCVTWYAQAIIITIIAAVFLPAGVIGGASIYKQLSVGQPDSAS